MKNPKIIFISHTFPPTVGGVETQNYELSKWLSESTEITIIANTRGRKFLPFFAIHALIKSLYLLPKHDVIILGSGVLAVHGWFIKLFSNKPVICVIHGLDINWNSASLGVWYEKILISIYQNLWIKTFLPKIDKYIAVGNETVRVAAEHGLKGEKVVFIPNGVDVDKNLVNCTRKDIEEIIDCSVENKKVLLTTGRLAKRKGVAWFISNVLPNLSEEYVYIVAGAGPDKDNIENAIKTSRQSHRVFMLGFITDEKRNILWNSADLFVQPNIKVPGDMEGFGISVIEACSCRLPVLASALEGLVDAIKEGKNGFLVEHENANAFKNKIIELFVDGSPREKFGQAVRDFVVQNFEWKEIAKIYLEEISKSIESTQPSISADKQLALNPIANNETEENKN